MSMFAFGPKRTWPALPKCWQGLARSLHIASRATMRRREFLTIVGGAAAWPIATRALQQLGWSDGRNVRIETRWAGGKIDEARRYAGELIALAPDVILASGGDIV